MNPISRCYYDHPSTGTETEAYGDELACIWTLSKPISTPTSLLSYLLNRPIYTIMLDFQQEFIFLAAVLRILKSKLKLSS